MIQALVAQKALDHKATPYLIGGVLLVGFGVSFWFMRKTLCATGLISCKKDKTQLNLMSYKGFDPNYYRPEKITISHPHAQKLAVKMKNAKGLINDDEGAIYSVLEEAGNANNLSLVAHYFNLKGFGSLSEFITYYMQDEKELKRIKDILKSYN